MEPAEYSVKDKILVRITDSRFMPRFILMFILKYGRSKYLDRNALANAWVRGIENSLGLHGDQFTTCVSVHFPVLAFVLLENLLSGDFQGPGS